MAETEDLQARIDGLKAEHRELDAQIKALTESPPFDQIKIQRLKKRKLALKDEIPRLHAIGLPDIIA